MEKQDVEAAAPISALSEKQSIASGEVPLSTAPTETRFQRFTNILKTWGVETHGCVYPLSIARILLLTARARIEPIPLESRTERRTYQFFFLWLSTNLSILTCVPFGSKFQCNGTHARLYSVSTGVSGPAFFSLGRRDSLVIILVVDLMYVRSLLARQESVY